MNRAFGVDPTNDARFNVNKLGPILEAIHERLAGVVIECLPYGVPIDRYDRPATLFYLDPPYWGTEDYYGENLFERADYERLARQLADIKGRFVLSLNDTPGVRDMFQQFDMTETSVVYSVRGTRPKRARELIITGP
jgi:DNA adenine methylase